MANGTSFPLTRNDGLISDEVIQYIYTINFSVVCTFFSIFGMVTNSINIAIFVRQGFRETINISLLGLAVSDLGSLISLLWASVCFYPVFMYSSLPILTIELQHFSGSWTHVIFSRITGFITVFITIERCFCVVFPLRVKTIFTPKRVKIIIINIYAITIASMSYLFFLYRLDWKYVERLNKTVIGNLAMSSDDVLTKCNQSQLFYPIFTFAAVILFTSILVCKINQRSRWRQSVTTGDKEGAATTRDRQVVKMVVYVAVIFIVSFTPSLIFFVVLLTFPGTAIGDYNENLFILSFSFPVMLEGFNSSVNIFVYYKTSSKFKQQFLEFFARKQNCSRAT